MTILLTGSTFPCLERIQPLMVKETLNDECFKGLNTNGLYLVALPSQLSALLLMANTDIV